MNKTSRTEEGPRFYTCDAAKNETCKKTMCHLNGGPCEYTTNPEYRKGTKSLTFEDFKKQMAAMLINERQKAMMQHALGMDHRNTYKRAGREWYRPYRNYYDAGAPDKEWEDLVEKRLAQEKDGRNGGTWYWVSKHGLEVLSSLLNIYIYSDNSDCAADAKNDIIESLIEHACYSGYGCWLPLSAEIIATECRLPITVTREALRILCEDGIAAHTYYGEGTEDGVMCTHGYEITEKGIAENKTLYDEKWKEECDRINKMLRNEDGEG